MDEGPRFFTLEEANALLPALRLALGDVARLRSELERAIVDVGGAEIAARVLQRGERAPRGKEAEGARLLAVAEQVTDAVERVNAMGCVLKDADAGLVDFYALKDDEPVFLCWQLGEPVVAHWHSLEGGFASREQIEGVEIERPRLVN
ncbi:MAG TPA: DUF2203 domain-containing protein [Anaeromyxobacteraceae bacterium]|nr:DUF2203 domain-containing protein [Anaeromyxobacteraceae bacterium]